MGLETIVDILDTAVKENAAPRNEYLGEDGLLHCCTCHDKRQTVVEFLGKVKTVRCACRCVRAEHEAFKEQERQDELDRKRRICFQGTDMKGWCFANDDRRSPETSDAMRKYAEQFPEFYRDGKGFLLYGEPGTGKTFFAACVANAVIDRGYSARMTNFEQIANTLSGIFEKQEYLDSLNKFDLLVIDDLGIEQQNTKMRSIVYNVIDARYRSGLPMIVTTNLDIKTITKPGDLDHERIYDRIIERCLAVKVSGGSRRREAVKTEWNDMRAKLGLGVRS